MSKADFGYAIAAHLGLDSGCTTEVEGALLGDAPRLRDMRLGVDKIEQELGVGMPTLLDEISLLESVGR